MGARRRSRDISSTFVESRPAHCVGGDGGGYAYRVGSAWHNASPATRFLYRLGKRANDMDRGDAGATSRRAAQGRGTGNVNRTPRLAAPHASGVPRTYLSKPEKDASYPGLEIIAKL